MLAIFGKLLKGIGKVFGFIRAAIVNGIFLLALAVIVISLNQLQPDPVPADAILWVEPTGAIVEQYSFNDPLIKLLNPEQIAQETALNDIVQAIELAASDNRIKLVVISPDKITSIGHSSINSIHRALDKVKAANKPILAISRGMQQHQYLLAAKADEISIHPMAYVAITGYGAYRDYMKSALDKLNVNVHVFRVGEFKSALEPFMRNSMSDEAKTANQQLLGGLWQHYLNKVGLFRELAPEDINTYANNYASLLQQTQGNAAKLALEQGLVDKIATNEAFWTEMETMFPALKTDSNPAIGIQAYLASNISLKPPEIKPTVAVVTLEGAIVDGEAPPGAAAGDTIAKLLWDAKNREDIKAVVLRVNSGGGSAFASEIIRERVLQLQREGKPVVVSMGNVAASGGYWVAANANQIWASPTTITGSIGIFAAIPTAEKAFEKLGIYNDGVGTTALADGFSLNRSLNPHLSASIQASIERGYEQFINLVSDGRNLEREATLAAAGGRVWIGEEAQALGLVDYLGEIEDAINAAGDLVGINGADNVIYLQDQRWAQFTLLQRFAKVMLPASNTASLEGVFKQWVNQLVPVWLRHPDPNNVYLRCVECSLLE